MAKGQFLMVESEQMENCRVEIVSMHRIFSDCLRRYSSRLSINHSAFDAATGRATMKMRACDARDLFVLRLTVCGQIPLSRRPAYLRACRAISNLAANQQSVDRHSVPGLVRFHVGMRVPIIVRADIDQFDETHAAFSHAPRDETLPGKTFRAAAFQTVELERRVGFLATDRERPASLVACRKRFQMISFARRAWSPSGAVC